VFDLRGFVVLYYSYALCFGFRLGILCLDVICFGCSFQFVVLFCVLYVVYVLVYRPVLEDFTVLVVSFVVMCLVGFALLFYYSRLVFVVDCVV